MLATHNIDGYVPGINDLLNGYKRPDGTSEPSADEKMQRGQKAINAFAAYRQLRADNPQAAKLALDTLRHISNIWAMATSRTSPNLCRLHLLYIGPFV